ncbi:MAG: YkgJ family cysteine cluster protein [Candidatus Eremiobacteraeota bacterium]|nr:YkgJ family cysteine cluster protein [Candidatus Eremiobacteraeota bacterium]
MEPPGHLVIECTDSQFTVRSMSPGAAVHERTARFVEMPAVRDLVRKLVNVLVTDFGDRLFSDLCGECGSCCTGAAVAASHEEIEAIAAFLAVPVKELLERFFFRKPPGGGEQWVIREQTGRCVFLRDCAGGTRHCAIYPVRPYVCSSLVKPDMPICRKSLGKLICHLERITFEGTAAIIVTRSGRILEVKLENPLALQLLQHLRGVLSPAASRENRRPGRPVTVKAEDFKAGPALLEMERSLYGTADAPPVLPSLRTDSAEFEIFSIVLLKDSLLVFCRDGTVFRKAELRDGEEEEIGKAMKALLRELPGTLSGEAAGALRSMSFLCRRCGKCCRHFVAEISPYDIERIALHLGIPVEETWKRYLVPDIFSWNEHNADLKKVPEGRGREGERCVFLGTHGDGLPGCSIYEARPRVCRRYFPGNEKCSQNVDDLPPEALLDSLVSFTISGDSLSFTTTFTESHGIPAPVIDVHQYEGIMKRLEEIKGTVEEIVKSRKS